MFFHTSILRVPLVKKISCAVVLRGVGHSARNVPLFLRCCRPPPTSCHDHRRHTAAHSDSSTTLLLSRIFQLPSFSYGLAESVSVQEAKTAEVVENISCERTLLPESHLRRRCVIPQSRVLRSVLFFRYRSTISGGLDTKQTRHL